VHHLYDLLAPTATPKDKVLLTHALGQLHQSLGQLEAALHWHRQQLAIAHQAADKAAMADAYFEMGELALVSNDYQAAVAAARTGLALCGSLEDTRLARLEGWGSRLLGAALAMEGSDLHAAERHLQEAAAAHRRIERSGDLCADLFELGNVAAQRGELARGLAYYKAARRAAESGHVYYFLALAYNNFAYHSLLLGRPQAAQEAVTQ